MSVVIKVFLTHCWKQDYKAATAARRICEVQGESVFSERVAQRWFQSLNTGEENTKDLPQSGWQEFWNIENIPWVLEGNPQESLRLSEELDGSKVTIHCQIITLWKSYENCRSVPHELTPQLAQRREDICRQLIGNSMDDRCIRRIVTCNENGSITANPDASKLWLGPRKAGNPLRAADTARHGPNGLNGKQLRVTHYVPRRALPCRPLVMGYYQLLSIKTIRAVPCCDVPCRAGRS